MAVPVPNAGNVVAGVGYLWTAPANTAAPADPTTITTATLPTDWSITTGWVYMGATDAGHTITETPTTTDITIEEQLPPALIIPSKVDFTISCSLAEDTLANMLATYGRGSIAVTAPGTTQVGKSTLTLADNIYNTLALGLEYVNKLGFPRRVYVPNGISSAAVGTPIRRAAKRVYPVTFRAICPLSSITVIDYTATHT